MEIISFEYIPLLERSAFLRYRVIDEIQDYLGETRRLVWGDWSWSEFSVGPWEPLRTQAFGHDAVTETA